MSRLKTPKKRVIFVLGGPGSGKGTVCNYVSREYGLVHLSAGQLLRKERDVPGSELGEIIDKHIATGAIVPAAITCKILRNAIDSRAGVDTFLIDGFPRNKENLDGWFQEMGRSTELMWILFLKANKRVLIKRCLGRSSDRRADDNLRTIQKRLRTFYEDTMPIISHFMNQNMVRILDTKGSKEEVFQKAREIFDQSL